MKPFFFTAAALFRESELAFSRPIYKRAAAAAVFTPNFPPFPSRLAFVVVTERGEQINSEEEKEVCGGGGRTEKAMVDRVGSD